MGFKDEANNIVGVDIELATAVCEKLGVKAVFQPISWDAKEMELETKRIDCIWNGMSITDERKEKMELSNPYLNNKIIVMTNKGVNVASKEDLKNYNVATQAKSSALEVIENDPSYDSFKDKVTLYPTYDEIILDMGISRNTADASAFFHVLCTSDSFWRNDSDGSVPDGDSYFCPELCGLFCGDLPRGN